MAEVFVVTCGDYSGYGIVAIFSTQAPAMNLAATIDGYVKSFPIDRDIPFDIHSQSWYLNDYGGRINARKMTAGEQCNEGIFNPIRASWALWKALPPYLAVFCYATAESHALRIFADIRAYIDAVGLWDVLAAGKNNCLRSEDVSTVVRDSLEGLLGSAPEANKEK